jgi:hypothetical protein
LFLIPTAHDPSDHVFPAESVLTVEQAERGEAPVDAVHPEVLRAVVGVVGLLRVRRRTQTWGKRGGVRREMREKGKEGSGRGGANVVEGLNVFDVEV